MTNAQGRLGLGRLQPAPPIVGSSDSARDRVNYPPEHVHRVSLTRLEIRRGGEPFTRQMWQMRHGGVPVENPEDEQMKGGVGIEPAIPPRVIQLP